MRCIFAKGKQRALLLFAKNSLGISWRDMADKLNIGYTTLRDWRDERYSMRYEAFHKLAEIHPRCNDFRDFIANLREDNWGRRLGGFRAKQKKRGFFDP